MRVDGIPTVPCSRSCSCWAYPDTGDAPASAATTTATAAASVYQHFKAAKGCGGRVGGKLKRDVEGAARSRGGDREDVPSQRLSGDGRGRRQPLRREGELHVLAAGDAREVAPVGGVHADDDPERDTVEQGYVERQLTAGRVEQPHRRDVVRLTRPGPDGIGATAGDGAAAGGQRGAEDCEQQRGAHDGLTLHSRPRSLLCHSPQPLAPPVTPPAVPQGI